MIASTGRRSKAPDGQNGQCN